MTLWGDVMSDSVFSCPNCDKRYRWKHELGGRHVRCKCGQTLRVPEMPGSPVVIKSHSGQKVAAGRSSAAGHDTMHRHCPSCSGSISDAAVLCVHCGYNLQTGQALGTSVGRAVKSASGPRRIGQASHAEGFFGRIWRSWEYVKISYGLLWDFKQLLLFPLLSFIATIIVVASFALPVWGVGTMEQIDAFLDDEVAAGHVDALVYGIVFLFYFCLYFVIVFFNTALASCALRVCAGETPSLGDGLAMAVRRLPQIVAWSLVSATVGLLLKIIENSNKHVGAIVAAILGTAWTVLTFFVVPVLAAEGVGPVDAFKKSLNTLKQTWGEALVGNFSMALLTFIIAIPLLLVPVALIYFAIQAGNTNLLLFAFVLLIAIAVLVGIVSSAADMVFRALLYNYATGRTIPQEIDEAMLESAFGSR